MFPEVAEERVASLIELRRKGGRSHGGFARFPLKRRSWKGPEARLHSPPDLFHEAIAPTTRLAYKVHMLCVWWAKEAE